MRSHARRYRLCKMSDNDDRSLWVIGGGLVILAIYANGSILDVMLHAAKVCIARRLTSANGAG